MKAITEFPTFLLTKGLAAKTALAAEGKSPEEIQQNLGETFKITEPKLKYFIAALDIAAQNSTDLKRVLVLGLGENESAPAKAVKIDDYFYVPEFIIHREIKLQVGAGVKSPRRGGAGARKDGPKSSPWGLSPEEKAAKNKGAAKK